MAPTPQFAAPQSMRLAPWNPPAVSQPVQPTRPPTRPTRPPVDPTPDPACPPGMTGRDGRDGKDGQPGRDGDPGPPGPPGRGVAALEIMDGEDPGAKVLVVQYTDETTEVAGVLPGRDGVNGQPGTNGKDGANGENGRDGVGIVDAYVDEETGSLFLVLSDETTLNLGRVRGRDGRDGRDGAIGRDGKDGRDADQSDLEQQIVELRAEIEVLRKQIPAGFDLIRRK